MTEKAHESHWRNSDCELIRALVPSIVLVRASARARSRTLAASRKVPSRAVQLVGGHQSSERSMFVPGRCRRRGPAFAPRPASFQAPSPASRLAPSLSSSVGSTCGGRPGATAMASRKAKPERERVPVRRARWLAGEFARLRPLRGRSRALARRHPEEEGRQAGRRSRQSVDSSGRVAAKGAEAGGRARHNHRSLRCFRRRTPASQPKACAQGVAARAASECSRGWGGSAARRTCCPPSLLSFPAR